MTMYKDLIGKTAVITGGDSGLGAATALRLGQEHVNVVINYYKNENAAHQVKQSIEDAGGKATIIQGDISNPKTGDLLVNKAVNTFGDLDIWINNSGIQIQSPTNEVTVKDWEAVINVNLTGTFLGTKAALNYFLKKDKKGNIINTSSVHQQIPWPEFASYATSKGGIKLFSETTAMEFAKKNVRINSIAPGAIDTPINAKKFADPAKLKKVISMVPMGTIGKPSDVANAAAWLASNQSSYVTGITLFVDGGMSLYPAFQNGNG